MLQSGVATATAAGPELEDAAWSLAITQIYNIYFGLYNVLHTI